MKYTNLVSRNNFCISKELQNKIKKCRILIIGCGLGSQIAILATRLGFENFILVDGDIVKINNLNRQGFQSEHLNKNKTEALTSILKSINPNALIKSYNIFLRNKSLAKKMINESDIVVNTADPDPIMYFINDYAQQNGKFVFFPLNIFWGGYLLIFTPISPRLIDIIKDRIYGRKFYFKLIEKTYSNFPPNTINYYKEIEKTILKAKYLPQLGSTTYLTSSLVINGIIKLLSGISIQTAPYPIFIDLWKEID